MPVCPECGSPMKKDKAFYVCEICGVSFKPWEIEKAQGNLRARKFKKAENVDRFLRDDERDKKRKNEYLNWYLKR